MEPAIDLTAIFTETDLVRLEFSRAGKLLLFVNMDRQKAMEWASAIAKAACSHHPEPKP